MRVCPGLPDGLAVSGACHDAQWENSRALGAGLRCAVNPSRLRHARSPRPEPGPLSHPPSPALAFLHAAGRRCPAGGPKDGDCLSCRSAVTAPAAGGSYERPSRPAGAGCPIRVIQLMVPCSQIASGGGPFLGSTGTLDATTLNHPPPGKSVRRVPLGPTCMHACVRMRASDTGSWLACQGKMACGMLMQYERVVVYHYPGVGILALLQGMPSMWS